MIACGRSILVGAPSLKIVVSSGGFLTIYCKGSFFATFYRLCLRLLQYLPPIMVTVHVQDMSFANATLGSRHSTMISASVNVSYFFILSPFFLTL